MNAREISMDVDLNKNPGLRVKALLLNDLSVKGIEVMLEGMKNRWA